MAGRMMVVFAVFALAAGTALGFSVSADGDRNLNGGANLVADGGAETITPTGTGGPATPYVYDWDDIDGAGTDASDNLALGGSKLHNNDGSCFSLRLLNANGKGTINGAGITAIETVDIWLTGRPERPAGGYFAGDVAITNVSDISMGGIVTSSIATGSVYGWAGDVQIGQSGNPAGNVRIGYLDTHGQGAGIRAGDITIYSTGDVRIQDAGGNPGDILGHATSGNSSSIINIQHDGAFRAGNIQDYLAGAWTGSDRIGSFTAEGDAMGDGASGPFECGDINQYFTYWSYRQNVGFVNISGYTSVHVRGDIDTHSTATGATTARYAGNVTIEDIEGDIIIDGFVNLQGANGTNNAYNGTLTLRSTGSVIRIGELDLNLVKQVIFDNASGDNYVFALLNFPTGDPLSANLAAPNQLVWYKKNLSGMDGIYYIADGGIVLPMGMRDPRAIPEPAGLGLLALALLGLRQGRR